MYENYVCMYSPYVWMDICMGECDACNCLYAYMLACGVMCFNASKDVSFCSLYVVHVCIYVCWP